MRRSNVTNYNELKQDHRVLSVRFTGGGIAVVTLQPGFLSGGEPQITAAFFHSAKSFVEAAVSE